MTTPTLTDEMLKTLREALDAPTSHSFPKGVIGAGCSMCGHHMTRPRPSCRPRSQVTVDTRVMRVLLDTADNVDVEQRELIERLAEHDRNAEKFRALIDAKR
jgi:hypothetical protein